MSIADDLTARFLDPNGFKKYIGFLGGKRAKAAHELYANAPRKGAAQAYILDNREHDGTYYTLNAISIDGDLDEQTLAELARAAKLVPLGTVRYEGSQAVDLPDAFGSNPEANDINSLSRLDRGILVYPVTLLGKRDRASWALWAIDAAGTFYLYPLEDKKVL